MTKKLYIVVALLVATTAIVGCVQKRGCTDSYSDNFDPEATQDDDTCEPTRDKFVGEYEANGTIWVGPDTLVPYDDVYVNIYDSTLASSNREGLILDISNMDPAYPVLPLSAAVSGTYSLNIIPQNIGEPYRYYGNGNINGRVLELYITRIETITLPNSSTVDDTTILNIYGIKELEE
jgi:hypothetical protein